MRNCNHAANLAYANDLCCTACGNYLLPLLAESPSVPDIVQFVHNQFRTLILDDRFPCVGARAAIHQNTYRFGLYPEIGSVASTMALEQDLKGFCSEFMHEDTTRFATFIASFMYPVALDEIAFENVFWQQLQLLHDHDTATWDVDVASDPDNPSFAFSIAGHAFFVIGLHAASSRWSRRFAWPTLIFNAHHQFTQLRTQGHFERFQQVVRTKEQHLQGTINPNLLAYTGLSAARQYAGRFVESNWQCPFHSHS
jgi:uncharacterized protein